MFLASVLIGDPANNVDKCRTMPPIKNNINQVNYPPNMPIFGYVPPLQNNQPLLGSQFVNKKQNPFGPRPPAQNPMPPLAGGLFGAAL